MGRSFHAVDLVDVTYICHERTKGSKNGVRLYQEPGTNHWTELGKLRYGSGYNNSLYEAAKTMTDEELKAAVNRKRAEDEFINAYKTESKTKQKLSKFAEKILDTALDTAGKAIGNRIGNSINDIAGNTFLKKVEARIEKTSKKVDEKLGKNKTGEEKKSDDQKNSDPKKEQKSEKKTGEEKKSDDQKKSDPKKEQKSEKKTEKAEKKIEKEKDKADAASLRQMLRSEKENRKNAERSEKQAKRDAKIGNEFASYLRQRDKKGGTSWAEERSHALMAEMMSALRKSAGSTKFGDRLSSIDSSINFDKKLW